jgi:ABC-type Fe3+-siderophore transport system permease subunit
VTDLRFPIGAFFVLLGALLLIMSGTHAQLGSKPVNLYAGLVMLVFGGVMLLLAQQSRR